MFPRQRPAFRLLLVCMLLPFWGYSQDTASLPNNVFSFPDKLFSSIDKKSQAAKQKLDRQTAKYLSKLERQEHKLRRKLHKKDSLLAKELFGDINQKYAALKDKAQSLTSSQNLYSGHLDSLSTVFSFLKDHQIGSAQNSKAVSSTLEQLQSVQQSLNYTGGVQSFLQQRRAQLEQSMQQVGMLRDLKGFKKQLYYYRAQVTEYRQAFEDPKKLEAKLVEALVKTPAFRDFFARNSALGQLFALPGAGGSAEPLPAGLQTRASVEAVLRDRFGAGQGITQSLQQNVRSGQDGLSAIRNQAAQYSSGAYGNNGGSEMEMPDFKPNSQKTKSFLKRLEWGTNFQSQRARSYFPVTTDAGLSLGYKLNDKSVLGIGAAYKVGWGSGWDKIRISHQGMGLRSFIDWKVKGNMFITGGYEQNYRSAFHSIDALKNYSAWQQSGLLGLTKKYKTGKLKGSMQLLWDFLSHQQVPRTQTIVWRVGYNIK